MQIGVNVVNTPVNISNTPVNLGGKENADISVHGAVQDTKFNVAKIMPYTDISNHGADVSVKGAFPENGSVPNLMNALFHSLRK